MKGKAIVREVDIYENERYSPISGWSSKGLLITDRSPFSSKDGVSNFSTIEEVSTSLLSTGWNWIDDSKWEIDRNSPNVDQDGWSFAVDFGGDGESYCGSKGIVHFVRRRRLVRLQTFSPQLLSTNMEWTCDQCDLEEVVVLSGLLLDALVGFTMQKHPRQLSLQKINLCKSAMVHTLRIDEKGQGLGEDALKQLLNEFSQSGRDAFGAASAAFAPGNQLENLSKRYALFDQQHFRLDERESMAILLIHKHDRDFRFHCNQANCGNECVFAPERCPHDGCDVVYSKKWTEKHDGVCQYKVLPCVRNCGESLPRKAHENHLQHACILRPVKCPFSNFGCMADLVYKDVASHMEDCTQSHMLLALNRMKEQEQIITTLSKKVQVLETKTAHQSMQLVELTAGAAAAMAAIATAEKRLQKHVADEVNKVDSKAVKKANDLGSEIHNELNKVKRVLTDLNNKEMERQRAASSSAGCRK